MRLNNLVRLDGNLTRDAELTETKNGKQKLSFMIGVSRGKWKGQELGSDFVPCELWGKPAELWAEWGLHKGDRVQVAGSIRINKQGEGKEARYFTSIVVDELTNLSNWARRKFDLPGPSTGGEIPEGLPGDGEVGGDVDIPF